MRRLRKKLLKKELINSEQPLSKVIVHGLDLELNDDDFKKYFETNYGQLDSAKIVRDPTTGLSVGCGSV